MFQNLWMQKTPHGFLRRLRSMLRHLAVVNGPLGYNLVAGLSDGLWMVASSDFWISKSSDHPKVSNERSIMVYHGLSAISCQIFCSEVLCLGLQALLLSDPPAPQLQAPAFCWSWEKAEGVIAKANLPSPGRNVNAYVRVYALKCGGDLSK